MKLSNYLVKNDLTLKAFAEQIGRTEATVSRLARGKHRPDWKTIEAIEKATNGKVRANDFFEAAA